MGTSKLKTFMAERDIRQQELCYLANVSRATLCEIMNGRRKPQREVAYRIADALNVKVNKLFDNW